MLGQPTAHLITDVELNRLVRDLLYTVPPAGSDILESQVPSTFAVLSPSRHHARSMHSGIREVAEPDPSDIDLEPAISVKRTECWYGQDYRGECRYFSR